MVIGNPGLKRIILLAIEKFKVVLEIGFVIVYMFVQV